VPQAPQLNSSVFTSTQFSPVGPQPVSPGSQLSLHWPSEQSRPSAQAIMHAPQWSAFDCVSMQPPAQDRSPPVHWQVLAVQSWPVLQTVPQAPQFWLFVVVSTQLPAQAIPPPMQLHTPALQAWPTAQALPHVPQLATSVIVFAHRPLQLVKPA